MNRWYITTPLYYVNAKAHLGTVYTTVIADILNRYHQLFKKRTFLLTGTDEHGQKCLQSAVKQNLSPKIYCDQMAEQFKELWKQLDISYNFFLRTTQTRHKQVVQKCLQNLYDRGLIYESLYEGWYCVSEEIFYTKKDLKDGKSPSGKEVTFIREKNYFFKMSNYQSALKKHILNNPDFIQPSFRRNEILSFLKTDLSDLCISRPKSRMQWGIELPFDSRFVTYVWVDALLNYLTGIGWLGPVKPNPLKPDLVKEDAKLANDTEWEKWWSAGAFHLIGKDILVTHCVYWPCLLLALDLPLPKTIFAHGWLLNREKEKMSKSQGDVMDPLALLKIFDSDSLRYFLVRSILLGNDSTISSLLIARCLNEDLANNFGNLIQRVSVLTHRHYDSLMPPVVKAPDTLIKNLKQLAENTALSFKKDLLNLQPQSAIEKIILLLNNTNKYLEQMAPWKLVKTDQKKGADVLRTTWEIIYLCASILKPILPNKMTTVLECLSCPDEWPLENFQTGVFPKERAKIKKIPPLFPRIDESTL